MTTTADLEHQFRAFLQLMQRAEETAFRALEFARAASAQDAQFQSVLRQAEENYRVAIEGRERAAENLRKFYDSRKD